MNDALKEKLHLLRERVDAGIDKFLPFESERPTRLHQAMRYSMEAGGKRIRPVLLLLASEIFPSRQDPLPAAVAVECLHTYTLIHDDLPAIDNSVLRRGRPSCHQKFDEATAILAGDALLTHAFQILARAYENSPILATALIGDLATASGSRRLIGGQMEDIENEGKSIHPDTLKYIHENKTAALLTASMTMGLRFTDSSRDQIEVVRQVGYHLGMAFQIIDDILDATSDEATIGKPVGNDRAADKSTYVALHGIGGANEEARRHTTAAVEATRTLGGNNQSLVALIESLGHRIN